MVWIDYVIIGIIIFFSLLSLIRGFVREALSLITLVCAFFIVSRFYPYFASYLTFFENLLVKNSVAIAILFIIILIIGSLLNYIITSLVQKAGLTSIDRMLGFCFGVLHAILIVSGILFFLDTFTVLPKSEDWKHSELIPQLNHIIRWLSMI